MDNHQALVAATELAQAIIDIGPIDDGDAPTPCSDFDVDELVDHIVDTHHFLAGAAGSATAAVEGSIGERHAAAAAASIAAWAERGTDGSVHLGPHELPAAFALGLHVLESYVHAWDLAAATRRPFEPTGELTEAAWEVARSVVSDDARSTEPGAPYGDAVEAPVDATDVERLIAFTGRQPRWSA